MWKKNNQESKKEKASPSELLEAYSKEFEEFDTKIWIQLQRMKRLQFVRISGQIPWKKKKILKNI